MDLSLLNFSRWYPGRLLAFSGIDGPTDMESGMVLRAENTPSTWKVLQPAPCNIRLDEKIASEWFHAGDVFFAENPDGVCLRGMMVDAWHILLEGSCSVDFEGEGLTLMVCEEKILLGCSDHFNPSLIALDPETIWRKRISWLFQIAIPEHVDRSLHAPLARGLSMLKLQLMSPEGAISFPWSTPNRFPHREMWLWDSCFQALAWRHIDPEMAKEILDAVISQREADGFIPHRMNPVSHSGLTQPPLLAMAVWKVHEAAEDLEWLHEVYPDLCAYVDWIFKHRDQDTFGLPEWMMDDPESSRGTESGMDNSPRFDEERHFDAIDFASYLSSECQYLSQIAGAIGREESLAYWRGRHFQLNGLMRHRLWSEETQFYHDYDLDQQAIIPLKSICGFLPLICNGASKPQVDALLKHLEDPDEFATRIPLPSIARNEPDFEKDMWRGPVWPSMVWLVTEGLERAGHKPKADHIRSLMAGEMLRRHAETGCFSEFFDPDGELSPLALKRKGVPLDGLQPGQSPVRDHATQCAILIDWLYRGVKPEIPELYETI